jgi:ferredoxin
MTRITVLPDDVHIDADEGETVLAALGRAGFRYRIGCRRGGCGVCKVHLSLGEVWYERPIDSHVLTDDERVEGVCLSCRAVPITNVVIELQEGDRLRRVLPYGFASAGRTSAVGPRASVNGRPSQPVRVGPSQSSKSVSTSQPRAEATSRGTGT